MAAYTLAKTIDDMIPSVNGFPGESFSGAPPQNFYNLRGGRALSSWDTPQTLVLSYVYELPFGPGKPFASGGGLTTTCWGLADQRQHDIPEWISAPGQRRQWQRHLCRHTAPKLEWSEPDA